MTNKLKKLIIKYKQPLKITYIILIIGLVLFSIFRIYQETSLSSIENAAQKLTAQKLILTIILGAIAVVPMAIYDFIYTRKTTSKVGWFQLFKDSYIINSFTNAGGSGGLVGASLRVYLFGKASSKTSETIKVVSQIALFTLVGLITNDLAAILFNFRSFFQMRSLIKWVCLLFPLYIFVPFIIPTQKLNLKDHFWLLIGSSLEWLFALGFFVMVGYIMGLHFNPAQVYLAVCFAGIAGAISMIPGGAGSFDSAIILGLSQFGISTGTAVTWTFIYRICYYIIPFILGIIMLLITVTKRKLKRA